MSLWWFVFNDVNLHWVQSRPFLNVTVHWHSCVRFSWRTLLLNWYDEDKWYNMPLFGFILKKKTIVFRRKARKREYSYSIVVTTFLSSQFIFWYNTFIVDTIFCIPEMQKIRLHYYSLVMDRVLEVAWVDTRLNAIHM